MKGDRKSIVIVCIYFIAMLFVFVMFVSNLKSQNINIEPIETNNEEETPVPDTQIVYIPIYVESTDTDEASETIETHIKYIVKSYENKIGIFKDDKLIDIIDIYTKTLPKADQRLLEKGIVASDRAELNALIEDYTG